MPLSPTYPIASARLLLRPLREADAEAMYSYRSLPEVCRWVPFEPMSEARIRALLRGRRFQRSSLEHEGEALMLGAALRGSGRLIGDLMLRWASDQHRTGEVGYVFHPEFGGKGYATEAVHALLHLAFDEFELHRVFGRVDGRNERSARLLRRLGMRQEAHLLENEWFKGEWSDELDFGLLEEEWRAQHATAEPSWPCELRARRP